MPKLREVDESFFSTAKARGVAELEMALSASQVFSTLSGSSWGKWVPIIRKVEWTSEKPYKLGTTRTVTLWGGTRLDEVFWAWEQDRRMAFCVVESNTGAVTALAECYDVTPISDRRCTVRWRMAMEFKKPFNVIEPYMKPSLGPSMLNMLKKLEKFSAQG